MVNDQLSSNHSKISMNTNFLVKRRKKITFNWIAYSVMLCNIIIALEDYYDDINGKERHKRNCRTLSCIGVWKLISFTRLFVCNSQTVDRTIKIERKKTSFFLSVIKLFVCKLYCAQRSRRRKK